METEGQNVASSSPSSPSLVSGRSVSRYSCEKTGLGMTMFDRSDASMELWRTSSKRVVCSWPALELPIRVLETSDRVKTTNSSRPSLCFQFQSPPTDDFLPPSHLLPPILWSVLIPFHHLSIFSPSATLCSYGATVSKLSLYIIQTNTTPDTPLCLFAPLYCPVY